MKAQLRSGTHRPPFLYNGSVQSFPVVQEGGYFALEHLEVKFAHLNKGLCNDLKKLVTDRQVRIQAFVQNKDWTTVMQSWQNHSQTLFPVEINIYGNGPDAEEVGRALCKSGIYLQYPRFGLDGLEYHNPHFLQIEGYSDQVPARTSTADEVETRDQSVEPETQTNDSAVVDTILDSLSHHADLGQISVDRRIKTTLLP